MNYIKFDVQNDTEKMKVQHYKNLSADSFETEYQYCWSEFLNWLSVKRIDPNNKYARGLMLCGEVNTGENDNVIKRRNNDNVFNRNMLVIDYDDLDSSIDFIQVIYERIGKLSYCIYSTYNHIPEKPRYRLVIPLSKPLDSKYYKDAIALFGEHIGLKYDESSKVASQVQALPVVKNKDSEFIFKVNDASIFDTDELLKKVDIYKEVQGEPASPFRKRDPSHWQSIAMGVGAGERNVVLAQLIGYLLRRYVDPSLVYGLAYGWAKQCTPPIGDKEITKTFKSIYTKHTRKE
ncbi:primase alpha helix C-terminal domain-containing protein [Staphylococcus pseudintermedius]|uniref:primase alpha helix C-terminal domain-containing protein n=1 Tax=Staphylococcus pseudintermedius TaxID=283734 RepID=UPI002ED82B1F|nr:primase alpha helix C-terminal domain-containing protein [Staphylococcus pseudintermedius]EIQ4142340.1 primase alpha helix C-terminal domain-containing protein [Staphylococcus pseudintermedius]MCE5464881.1 primase alpha helix C-terminal domain-containing protein [Staphylococcus pseudintermedius]MCE5498807.1 primase alpha helix C-terminal domain-containing protein [Staphylococcus pseudintermedius]MCE5732469.1 primase alpha helix C-terminal domain-containing protein [Staphylococcus pseudinterm